MFTGTYLDDRGPIIIFSNTWEEHLEHLKLVFDRIGQASLTLKKAKFVFTSAEVAYFGHVVGLGKVAPRSLKADAIFEFKRPTDKKQQRSFLGIAESHFAQIAACLTNLLCKNQKFI